jgi:LuxR family maltose regulon positive regulatory protein
VLNTLVTTKLHIPRTRPNLVARQRLRDLLGTGEGHKLTLVSAPAGFGKTTLLVDWLEGLADDDRAVAWVSLDEIDNDLSRFWSYLVASVRTVHEDVGEAILTSLRSPEFRTDEIVGNLINVLAALPRAVILVLDDYHVIDTIAVHEAVSFLLEHLPSNVHLVISCRTDPPLPLAKLRARGQITELRAAELRFTPEEATAFLGAVMGLTLSPEDVAALAEVTEGWVAALQLAALSMRDHTDVGSFVRAFSWTF